MNRRSFIKSIGLFIIGSQIPIDIQPSPIFPTWYGVPYHQSNATTGTWLGISRLEYPKENKNASSK